MKTFRLSLPGALHPLWVSAVNSKGTFEAEVSTDGTVLVEGEALSFSSQEPPPPRTKLKVWFSRSGFLESATVPEFMLHQQMNALKESMDKMAKQATEQRLHEQEVAKARDFSQRYAFPFAWKSAIKERYRSLSPLAGGATAATVLHILMEEDFVDGKLSRKIGDFLCEKSRVDKGWNTSGQAHTSLQLVGDQSYMQPPTCKACLAKAAKWLRTP